MVDSIAVVISGAGPRGRQGIQGEAGAAEYELATNIDILIAHGIAVVAGYAVYSDNEAGIIALGFSTETVLAGTAVTVRTAGKLVVTGAGWTPVDWRTQSDGIVYISTAGTLTQEKPTTGLIQEVGIALEAEILLLGTVSTGINGGNFT